MLLKQLSFIFLFHLICCFGQEPNSLQYSTNNGLTSSEIYDVIQDDYGYLWISSDNGLNRYNGVQFEQYSVDDGLTDNTVFRFKKDPYGRIWCTTYNNTLFLISGKNPTFIPYKYNDGIQKTLRNKVIKEMFFDNELNVYLTTMVIPGYVKIEPNGTIHDFIFDDNESNLVVYNYSLNKNENFFAAYPADLSMQLKFSQVDTILVHEIQYSRNLFNEHTYLPNSKTTVFGINDRLIISRNGSRFRSILLEKEFIDLGKFKDDWFWVSTRKGGVSFYNSNGDFQFQLLNGKSVSSVYLDHENSLWVGTLFNGLFYFENWKLPNLDPRSSSTPVSNLQHDSKNALWIGYEDGEIYVQNNKSFEKFKESNQVRPALFFQDEKTTHLFYFANGNIYNNWTKDSIEVGTVNKFKVFQTDSKDSMLIGKSSGLGYRSWADSSQQPVLENCRVSDFIRIGSKNYIASQKGLFYRNQNEMTLVDTNKFYCYRFNVLEKIGDYLLAGSSGGGLLLKNDEQTHLLNESLGLVSNFINNIYIEQDSTIWVATNKGISRIVYSAQFSTIKNFTKENGLIDNHVTSISCTQDTVWIGTHKGLTFLLKSDLDKAHRTVDYRLHISSVQVNDLAAQENDFLSLNYNQNRVKFNFQAFFFGEAKDFKYRYKLHGSESKWNYTKSNSAVYSSLSPGSYSFQVQFKGNNEDWNTQTSRVKLTIHPPYWKTIWFRISIFSLVCFFIYLFFKYKVIIYNGDVLREILRYFLKKIRKEGPHILIKESGTEYKIFTEDILYIQSDRNYLEIHTETGKHLIREKIGNFLDIVPDPIEFLRIKRSYIIRIDKVTEKGKKFVKIGKLKLDVGDTYLEELDKIII